MTIAVAKAASTWRMRFLHGGGGLVKRLTVHATDRGLRLGTAVHLDETKAFGATRLAFHSDLGAGDRAKRTKRLLQVLVTYRARQIADVKFVVHRRRFQKTVRLKTQSLARC